MVYLKGSRSRRSISPSQIAIVFILLASLWLQLFSKRYKNEGIIKWDIISYYAYLPATFIHNDVTLRFIDSDRATYSSRFWPSLTPEHKYVIKTTMGMSVLYSPFFSMAHLLSKPLGYPASGFSSPYQAAIAIAALFYLSVGLIVLRKILKKYFEDKAVAISLLLITLGTNLWWYTGMEPGMSHVYSFSLFALFILFTEKWIEKPNLINTITLGVLSGLITLVRPSNVVVGILILLWKVGSVNDLKVRVNILISRWNLIGLMILAAIMVWVPQMIYWKLQTGHLFYNSYGEEGFFFMSPKFIDGLFSYRKGLFLYTPVIAFASLGFFLLSKYVKGSTIALVSFMVLNLYVIFSWWSWWYGGSYGMRAAIDSFAIMVFPLTAIVQWSLSKTKFLKISLLSFILLLFSHSIFQTFQYYYGAIHWDSMTKEAYWDSFGRVRPSKNFKDLIVSPSNDALLMEDSDEN